MDALREGSPPSHFSKAFGKGLPFLFWRCLISGFTDVHEIMKQIDSLTNIYESLLQARHCSSFQVGRACTALVTLKI